MTAVPIHASVGNGARFAACPLSGGGTPLQVWLAADRSLPALDLTPCREIVVVGAHPDDETLGFGATTALLAELGVRVQVVSATDGGASYPGLSLLQRYRLEQVRRAELHRAAGILGPPPRSVWVCLTVRSPITRSGWPTCSARCSRPGPPEPGVPPPGGVTDTPTTRPSGVLRRPRWSAPAPCWWSTRSGCGTGPCRVTPTCRGLGRTRCP